MDNAQQDIKGQIKKSKQLWKPIFEPQSFWSQHDKPNVAQNVLSKRQLKYYGMKVSQIRESLRDRANEHSLLNQDYESLRASGQDPL